MGDVLGEGNLKHGYLQDRPIDKGHPLQCPTSGRCDEGGINLRLVCAHALDDRDGVIIERILTRGLSAAHLLGKHGSEGDCSSVRFEQDVQGPLASLAACRHLVVHAAKVRAIAGIDLDLRVRLNEQGHLNLCAGLERRRLGAPR